MSISTSNEYKLLRRSHSLPHIASRHDSGVSGITATTNTGTTTGSCSVLDQIDYDSAMCNEHQFNNQTRHYNKVKYNHNYHHHNHHQQCEQNVRLNPLFNCYTFLPFTNTHTRTHADSQRIRMMPKRILSVR